MIKTKGFTVIAVAGLERIEIDPVVSTTLTYAKITIVDQQGHQWTYDQEGLEDLIEGLTRAARLAESLNLELQANGE